jgi:hypothetical protein
MLASFGAPGIVFLSALAAATPAAPALIDGALVPQGGVVEGLVYDSTASRPLEGARVFLWNTDMFAETDEMGHFEIEDVPAGEYSLVFFHPRLTALGVSSGRTPIVMEEDDRVSVALSTPSMVTIMSLLCELEDPGQPHGRAIGFVGDASTGVPLPGAQVVLTWTESSAGGKQQLQSSQVRTDSDGWYSVCTLPDGVDVEGTAYFLGQSTNSRSFRLRSGMPSRVDFSLGSLRPGDVSGILRDAETHRPIPEAEVSLGDGDLMAVTDGDGRFRLRDVPPGPYMLEVRHLAYGTRTDPLQVGSDQDMHVELELDTRPIELDPIVVTTRSREEAQALAVGGRLIARAQIDQVRTRSQDMGDVLMNTNTAGLVISRGGHQVCVGFRRGQVTMQRTECTPAQVYINDVPTSDPTIALNLAPEVIDRVIIVPPVEAGVLYGGSAATGVILVYTRNR